MIQSMVKWDHSTEWSVADFSGKVNLFYPLINIFKYSVIYIFYELIFVIIRVWNFSTFIVQIF